jgi:osmotically-inducible protein OsmY
MCFQRGTVAIGTAADTAFLGNPAMSATFDTSQYITTLPTPRVANASTGTLHSIERRLRESSYYYLRTISAAYEAGVVTLTGRVPTFSLKQTVQALVEKIEGVERVVNLVDVVNPAGVQ